jgi:ABC-2 type transport system ATP-binding protein
MSDAGLRARGVTKLFRGARALDEVDLDVAPGSIVAVSGANGAGKTTLLRVFATLLRPDGGDAWVDGHSVLHEPDAARSRIGVALVNERALYWRLDPLQNLRFFARLDRFGRREADVRARAMAAAMGIDPFLRKRVARLSAGQRQRVILARAFLADPSVLLLDEPTRGLDDDGVGRVRSQMRLAADRGATVMVAAPTLAGLEDMFDHVHEIAAGAFVRPARALAPVAGEGA